MIRVMFFIMVGVVLVSSCAPETEPMPLPEQVTELPTGSFLMREWAIGPFTSRPSIVTFGDVLLGLEDSFRPTSEPGYQYRARQSRMALFSSNDGITWDEITSDVFGEIAPDAQGFAFRIWGDELWAFEWTTVEQNETPPDIQRIYRSHNGVDWDLVTESLGVEPMFHQTTAMGDSGVILHSYRRQVFDVHALETGEYLFSRNGRRWEVGFMPGLAETDADGFGVVAIGDRVLHIGYERKDGLYLQHLWMLDVKERTFTPLAVQTEVPPDVPAESVSRRLPNPITGRKGGALVVHDGAWYLIGGETRSSLNEFDYFVHGSDNNDVWRSYDGSTWELISRPRELNGELDYAFDTFPERSGAQVVSWRGVLYLTGGEGLGWIPAIGEPGDPDYIPAGPGYHYGRDVWVSRDGIAWHLLAREEGAYERVRAEYMEGERAFYFNRRREFEASQ